MKNHLLSIFPLQGVHEYARLSCLALDEMCSECAAPFTVSSGELLHMLASIFPVSETQWILSELELGHTVQVPISNEQSRDLGFQPKLN